MVLVILVILSQVIPQQADTDVMYSSNCVVINEFMHTPQNSCTEADGEWIELYNNTGEWVNLSGWIVENNYGEKVILSTYLLPPDGYFILASCGDDELNGGIDPNLVYDDFTIDQTGSLALYSQSRSLIDFVEYNLDWPILDGISCEKINPGWLSCDASSWDYAVVVYGAGDLGTPGSQNSVFQNNFVQNSWAFIKAFVQ